MATPNCAWCFVLNCKSNSLFRTKPNRIWCRYIGKSDSSGGQSVCRYILSRYIGKSVNSVILVSRYIGKSVSRYIGKSVQFIWSVGILVSRYIGKSVNSFLCQWSAWVHCRHQFGVSLSVRPTTADPKEKGKTHSHKTHSDSKQT